VVKATTVGTGPTGIAWDSANEDIFVCNQGEGTVSLISGFTLDVRKTLRNQISRPVEVALTPRQFAFGFARGVYFGYILNQNGNVAFFESGPDGINGIGFDDVIGSLPFRFQRPKALQPDPTALDSAVWIVHEFPLGNDGQVLGGGGALSKVGISGGTVGPVQLDSGPFGNPQIRDLEFDVFASLGEGDGLSGIPVDLAFDNMRNYTALTNFNTVFSPGNPLSINGKGLIKNLNGAGVAASAPQFLFAAVPNPGVVDVFDITSSLDRVDANPYLDGFQSIVVPNASVLMDYFRQ
jgi:DNA-binding beta-propeller fold protein YncE